LAWFREHAERRARGEAVEPTSPPAVARGETLKRLLGLDDAQLQFVYACACVSVDPMLHAPLVAVGGPDGRRGLSLAAYGHLSAIDPNVLARLARWLASDPPLLRLNVIAPALAGLSLTSTPFQATPRLAAYLAGSDALDPTIARLGGVVDLPQPLELDPRHADVVARIAALLGGEPVLVMVIGPRGVGRRTVIAAAASRIDRRVIAIDAERTRDPLVVRTLIRDAMFANAIPTIGDAHALDPEAAVAVAAAIDDAPGTCVVTTNDSKLDLPVSRPVLRFELRAPDAATRGVLWRAAVEEAEPATVQELAMRYPLGPGAIRAAAKVARRTSTNRTLTRADLLTGVRHGIVERFGDLAERLEVSDRWEDVVLPVETLDQLDALVSRVRHAYKVFEEWRFPQSTARGGGVAALFSGPPGTGKTLVAGVLARELDRDLFRVDLSQVVSKWVGETEKQLGELFDAAESSDALMLFDEADSLFARRTEVKSSSDRYANLEVNYLLQRIETFRGVTILTTNLDTSIDAALRRRLAAHIVFWPPDHDERARLWDRYTRCGPPLAGEIDVQSLAADYPDMTGANIRNVCLAASFLAAASDSAITHDTLVRAARSEYRAMGRVLGRK
jgi:hypothetical protein